MNRLKGLLIISLNVLLFFVFGLCLAVFVPDLFKKSIDHKNSYIASFVFLALLILSVYGFIKGLQKIKKTRTLTVPYDKCLNIYFTSQIEYEEYRNLIFGLSFKRPFILIMFSLILLNILNIFVNKSISLLDQSLILQIIIGLSVVIFVPLIVYYQTRQVYKSNKLFHEKIIYSIDNHSVKITGETFNSELKWVHFNKIKETKNFFMLYHDKVVANLLDKKNMNTEDITKFRLFIRSLNLYQE